MQKIMSNRLKPVKISGDLVPWLTKRNNGTDSEYKLICSSGLEYFIVANAEWQNILNRLCWQNVKVIGLLNAGNMTLIPQKIFPRRPPGNLQNVIDIASWQANKLIERLVSKVNENAVLPVAVLTWMLAVMM